jgi:hypothetical protein
MIEAMIDRRIIAPSPPDGQVRSLPHPDNGSLGSKGAMEGLQDRSDPLRVALSAQSEPDGCRDPVGSYEPQETRDVHEEPEAVHACCSGLSFE